MERNDGSIFNPDYNPNEDKDINRLRGLANEHIHGELAELSDDDWMLLLDNDVGTMYCLRGDECEYEPYSLNPHNKKFPDERDITQMPHTEYGKTDWLRLIKWDIRTFNEKRERWLAQDTIDGAGGNTQGLDLTSGFLAHAFMANADLAKVDLITANLIDANLTEANLSEAYLMMTDLSGAHLVRANLSKASLRQVNLYNADLIEANLSNSEMRDANLETALMMRADISDASLISANLAGASLLAAKALNADFTDADLSEATLKMAKLSGAILIRTNLAMADLNDAEIDDETKFDPVSLRGANCGNIEFEHRNFKYLTDAVDVDFDGCKFQKVYFHSSMLGKLMVREKAYEWGLQKKRGRELETVTRGFELRTSEDEVYESILKSETDPDLKYRHIAEAVHRAGYTYLNLKANWQDIGYYDDASWAAVHEKECERKTAYALMLSEKNRELDDEGRTKFNNNQPIKRGKFILSNFFKWIGYSIFNGLCQYGENPLRLVFWAIGLIVLFSFLYPATGVNATVYDPGNDPALHEQIISYSLNTDLKTTFTNAGRFFYYSVITFTTVGYGDYHPVGWLSHMVAIIEAFLGLFIMGLFIWCLGRRVGAR